MSTRTPRPAPDSLAPHGRSRSTGLSRRACLVRGTGWLGAALAGGIPLSYALRAAPPAAPPSAAADSPTAAPAPSEPADLDDFLVRVTGEVPIVLTAPHGGDRTLPGVPPRQGVGVRRFVTGQDARTFDLAQRAADELARRVGRPYCIFARWHRKFVDANRVDDEAYESSRARPYYAAFHNATARACFEVLRRWQRGLLIDIHGQAAYADSLIRGTNNLKTCRLLLERFGPEAISGPRSVPGGMAARGYKVLPPLGTADLEPARYDGGYIVTHYGSDQPGGLDAIQLEFGSQYRRSAETTRQAADDLAAAVEAFYREYLPPAG